MCCFERFFDKTIQILIFFWKNDFLHTTIPFNHSFSMTVIGPSQSGKLYWIYRLLCSLELLVTPIPKYVIYLYSTIYFIQYDVKNILENKKNNELILGYDFIPCTLEIPIVDDLKKFLNGNDDILLILDDLMFLALDDKELSSYEYYIDIKITHDNKQ